jgi:exosortase E/protease (VPEID-CTERM system)
MDLASATLSVEGFAVVIAPICSGYEGIGLLSILVLAYLVMFRNELRFPHVLALLPIGIALSWLANVLRLSVLMLVGARWSSELALGSFHSKAGWVLFCGIALGLVTVARRTAIFHRDLPIHDLRDTWNPTAAYLTPLLALVSAHLATGLFTTGFPLLYPVGVVAGAALLCWHRLTYSRLLRPSWSWGACTIGVAAFLLWIALEPAPDPTAIDDWQLAFASLPVPVAALWLLFRVLGSVLIVPVAEELAFRGYLLRRLLSADFTSVPLSRFGWVSFLVSSAAFGLLHDRWFAGILAGMLFGLAQYRRGRLSDAVLAHAVTNLLVALHAIGWNQWSLWT